MNDKEKIESVDLSVNITIQVYKGKVKDIEERIEALKITIEKSRKLKRDLEMMRMNFETIVRELER